MSCQGTRADAILIQAVANCLYLSVHMTESFETFAPVTVVQAVNVTGEYTNIYIGHISETNSLLKQLFLTLTTSSYKIADQSELNQKCNYILASISKQNTFCLLISVL